MRLFLAALSIALPACTGSIILGPPVPTPMPTATPRETPKPGVEVRQYERGRAVVRVDLTRFVPPPNSDYFVFATFLPAAHAGEPPESQILELSIRGTSAELCTASPCGPSKLGLVARWSPNIAADHRLYLADKHRPETDYAGEGIKSPARLPVGGSPVFDAVVEWAPGLLRVSTPVKAWSPSKPVGSPRFGWHGDGPQDIGLGRDPWRLTGALLEWTDTSRAVRRAGVVEGVPY